MLHRPEPSGVLRHVTAGDGTRLAYRVWGDYRHHAPVVLCLGGLSRNSRDFEDLAEALSPTHQVIAPDYRGRGESQWCDWRRYRPEVYLDDVRHLLAAEDRHRIIVVGTSLGAFLGMALAAVMPSSIAGLVNNDAGPDVPQDGLAYIIAYLSHWHQFESYEAAVEDLKGFMPPMSLDGDGAWLRFAQATFRVAEGNARIGARAVPDWDPDIIKPLKQRPQDDTDLWALFRATHPFPSLLVRGGVSTFLLEETAARMVGSHPRMQRIDVPGVGHTPSLTEPDVLATIRCFIGDL
ncbi:MAG: alpha/beta hydrolase [Alphaproteobacteria bacterium]|nr:alpha/beta hydrolase [Alphaproteobacteria bacterium]